MFECKYFQSKRKFIKSVFKVISCVFLHTFHPSFLTQILELSIAISTDRDLCCERILGDQSVVITKVLLCTLRRRTCGFAIVSGSSENLVFEVRPRRALWACSVFGNKRGTRESKSSSGNSL